jgi:hypothetical protein
MHGLLHFRPQDPPNPEIDAGVTEFYGHLFAKTSLSVMVGPVPVDLDGDLVLNVDADRDGHVLGGERDVDDVFNLLHGDFSSIREILGDIQLGANGAAVIAFPNSSPYLQGVLKMEAGRGSVVLNGLTESVWVRGQQGGKVFPSLPVDFGGSAIVTEGLIDFNGGFFFSSTTSYAVPGVDYSYNFTISNAGISARVTGKAEFNVNIDLGPAGSASGKAVAEVEGTLRVEIDEHGNPQLSGSITASGKLKARGNTVFSGSIDAKVTTKGMKFKFPKGVGSISLDLV